MDPLIKSQLLYQLSYAPEPDRSVGRAVYHRARASATAVSQKPLSWRGCSPTINRDCRRMALRFSHRLVNSVELWYEFLASISGARFAVESGFTTNGA